MNKNYRMQNLGIEVLVGRKIIAASINENKDLVILDTDKGKLYLTWEGECCASCYLVNVSGTASLMGATVLEVNHSEWKDINREDDYEVIESMGTNIKTDKGYATFETRLEHNGYYGGMIMVSDDEPMDQYHSPRYDKNKKVKTKPLEDF